MKKIIILLLSILIFYILYFQAAVKPIFGFNQILLSLIFFFFYIVVLNQRTNISNFLPLEQILLMIFFIYTFITGLIVTPNLNEFLSMEFFIFTSSVFCIILSFIIGRLLKKPDYIFWVILASTIFLSLTLILNGTETRYGRMTVSDVNNNEIANIINLGFIAVLFLWIKSSGKIKFFLVLLSMTQFGAVLLTGSRKSLIGMILLLIVLYILRSSENFKINLKSIFKWFLIVITTIIMTVILLPIFLQTTLIGERLMTEESGDAIRQELYANAFNLFLSNPFVGVGIRGFEHYFGIYSHSTYAELLSSTGLFGSIIYILVYVVMWKKLTKLKRQTNDDYIKGRLQVLKSVIIFMAYLGITMIHFYGFYSYIIIGCISGYIIHLKTKNI